MASSRQVSHSAIAPSKPETSIFTIGAHIWSAITSVDGVRTILTHPEPQATNASTSWSHSSKIGLISAGSSTKCKLKLIMPFPLPGTNSRPSSGKVSENPPCSWLTSGSRSSRTPNTSKKKYKIGPFICNTLNPSW